MPQTMKAILVRKPGDREQLYHGEFDVPEMKPDEVLVKVKAFALNRMDVLQREGKYPVPPGTSPILGVEFSGLVEKVGGDVPASAHIKPGDRVYGLVPGGAYAEYVPIDYRMVMKIPESMSFVDAAAFPEAFFTAYQALFTICQLKQGESALIHAGASGVGTSAIQLAKHKGAGQIFTTCGSDDKAALLRKLGASEVINYKTQSFKDIVSQHAKSGHPDSAGTGAQGVDVVVDFIGAGYFADNLHVLATDGRMVHLALMGGAKVDALDLSQVLRKRLRIEGSTLRARSRDYQVRLRDGFVRDFGQDVDNGELKPVVYRVMPWSEIKEAHRIMEANENTGKIVMTVE
ncbi:hypothetical protein RI367_000177 [Sorochytrium milnesiophthora]